MTKDKPKHIFQNHVLIYYNVAKIKIYIAEVLHMSKIRKILLVILSAVFVCVGCAAIVACSGDWHEPKGGVKDNGKYDKNNPGGAYQFYYPDGVDPKDYEDKSNRYVIHTISMGGAPLDNVRVTVSQNGSEIVEGYSQQGVVEFGIPTSDYELSYSNLPAGYREDNSGTLYSLNAEHLEVTTAFTSSVIRSSAPAGKSYQLGEVMYNFSITDYYGTTMNLATIFETKRFVVLNFWATWCGPCVSEFPSLNSAYNNYKNLAEVIAVSAHDSNFGAKNFKEQNNLNIFIAEDSANLSNNFDTSSIPVSVFIDRYGVVAQIHMGAITDEMEWESLFKQYTADDYKQDLKYEESNDSGSEPVKPGDEGYEGFTQELEPDDAINQAFLEAETLKTYSLKYHNPEDGTDAIYNWPWRVRDDDGEGMYITPSNIGVDNSFSIIRTEIDLKADDILSVELKINTSYERDLLYVVVNNNLETTYEYSGAKDWFTLTLFRATRATTVTLDLVYQKDMVKSQGENNEYVMLKNLKVATLESTLDPNVPTDARTEVIIGGDQSNYNLELKDDGFYHITKNGMDSILFVNIIGETLWSDIHLADYELKNVDNQVVSKSLYNISYWAFLENGDLTNDFGYGVEHTNTIIDCFYIQDSTEVLVPVNARVAAALKAFVEYAANSNVLDYDGGYDPDTTWLELCNWYRTLGADNHTVAGHTCLATTNPATGRNIEYAIELKIGETAWVDTNRFTLLNFAGGLFYKLTATETGVYRIQSLYESKGEGDAVDPKVLIWPDSANVMGSSGYREQEDSRSMKDYLSAEVNHDNFNVIVYLKAGETIYPQITTRLTNYTAEFPVKVEYLGAEWWEFETATLDGGSWVGEDANSYHYAAIDVMLIGDYYYRMTNDYAQGSVLYIDLIHKNFYDTNGHSIEEMVSLNYFNLGSQNYTGYMIGRIEEAKKKDPSDPTYGMVKADETLVEIICAFTNSRDEEGKSDVKSGIWEAFAFYWEYYGSDSWKELPDNWASEYLNK